MPATVILEQFPELVKLQQQFHRQDQRWSHSIAALLDTIPENLPRSGVVEFVGRAEAIEQLDQMLQQGDRVSVSAIAGMGGMGKTELALQYALAYKQRYPAGICWLQARAVEVGTQLVRFAQSQLSLNPPDTFELLDQVKYCWRNWRSGDALLIFDDVTDYDAIEFYLPPLTEARFKVLLTTRLQLGRSVNQLELDVLDEAAALALLESLVGGERIQAELNEAKLLCEQLGYLPLGLELVGRYVDRKSDLSLVEMRQRLQAKQLTAQALRQPDADMTARLGVAAAFQLSWETLSEDAKQLGYLLSLFAAAPIPWSLVEQCFENRGSEYIEETRDSELLNLHLLQRTATATYRLHPLIREFFQSQLAEYWNADVLKQQFCQVMAAVASEIPLALTLVSKQVEMANLAVPHLVIAATTWQNWLSRESLILVCTGLGNFYQAQGLYAEAYPWRQQCLTSSRNQLSKDHLYRSSLNNLAYLRFSQGHYLEAESLWKQAITLTKQVQGEPDLNVARYFGNLAEVYRTQGRYDEAEPFFLQALEIERHLLGEVDINVAKSLNNLAALHFSQGRYSEAKTNFQSALEIYKKLVGYEHLDTAQTLLNLGNVYEVKGLYSQAEYYHKQALKLRKHLLGEEHPLVATSCHALAMVYFEQMYLSKAEPLLLKALELRWHFLDEAHPDLVISLHSVACLYYAQGRFKEAEPLFKEAIDIAERQGMDKCYVDSMRKTYNDMQEMVKRKKRHKDTSKKAKNPGRGFGQK